MSCRKLVRTDNEINLYTQENDIDDVIEDVQSLVDWLIQVNLTNNRVVIDWEYELGEHWIEKIYLVEHRPENDFEYQERLILEKSCEDMARSNRRKQYEALKKEFET